MPGDAPAASAPATAPATNGAAPAAPATTAAPPASAKDATAAPAKGNGAAPSKDAAKDTAAAAAAPAKKDSVAEGWAKIGAAEAAVKKARDEVKREREELAKLKADIEAGRMSVETLKGRLTKGEFNEVAAELGLDYNAWTKRLLGSKKDAAKKDGPVDAADLARIVEERVQKALEERDQKRTKNDEAAREEHWKKTMEGFTGLAKSKDDAGALRYELLADEIEANASFVEKTLREIAAQAPHLTLEQAAEKYEAWLLDRARAIMSKSKVKALLGAQTPEAPKTESKDRPREPTGQQASEGGPRTLTNSLAAERASERDAPQSGQSRTAQIRAEREAEADRLRRATARITQG